MGNERRTGEHTSEEREDFYSKLADIDEKIGAVSRGLSAYYDTELRELGRKLDGVSRDVAALAADVHELTRVELRKARTTGRDYGGVAGAITAVIMVVLERLLH